MNQNLRTSLRSPQHRTEGKSLLLGLAFVALLGGGAYAFFGEELGLREPEIAPVRGQIARRGNLKITVIEGGNLSAANSTDLTCDIEGRTTILFLIEEGTMIKGGELLCELDVSNLMDRQVQQEISVQSARASYVKAKQNFEIQKSTNESNIARAERELEFAGVDLEKYIEGEWPQEQQKAVESILLAREELKRSENDLEWSERLAAKGFLEATQLEKDRLSATSARIRLDQQVRAKDLLEKYENPRQKKELEANVEEMHRELDRTHLEATAKLVDFEANLNSAEAKRNLEESEFEELVDQIGKAKIFAPGPGMVVYAMEGGGRWGRDEPMAEGKEVRERQKIITIPSSEGMVAEVSLHESVLEKVTTGMNCVLSVDAVGDKRFAGQVKFKAILPDKNSWWANPDLRVYRTEVQVLDTDARLRPGMTCSVEILVDELEDVVHIPIQSVFLDGGSPVCFVGQGRAIEKRSVEIGQDDGKWVHIKSGVEAGEEVLLSQPDGFTLAPAELKNDGDLPSFPAGDGAGERKPGQGAPGGSAGGSARGDGKRGMGQGQKGSGQNGQGQRGGGKGRPKGGSAGSKTSH